MKKLCEPDKWFCFPFSLFLWERRRLVLRKTPFGCRPPNWQAHLHAVSAMQLLHTSASNWHVYLTVHTYPTWHKHTAGCLDAGQLWHVHPEGCWSSLYLEQGSTFECLIVAQFRIMLFGSFKSERLFWTDGLSCLLRHLECERTSPPTIAHRYPKYANLLFREYPSGRPWSLEIYRNNNDAQICSNGIVLEQKKTLCWSCEQSDVHSTNVKAILLTALCNLADMQNVCAISNSHELVY